MKIKTFLRNALLPVLMVCSPAWAQMTTGKIHMEERHGAWSSFILEFPSLITYRATASGNDPSVLLTLDVFSDTCNSNLSFIFPFGAPLEENRDSVGVQIDARVDSGKMFYPVGPSTAPRFISTVRVTVFNPSTAPLVSVGSVMR